MSDTGNQLDNRSRYYETFHIIQPSDGGTENQPAMPGEPNV